MLEMGEKIVDITRLLKISFLQIKFSFSVIWTLLSGWQKYTEKWKRNIKLVERLIDNCDKVEYVIIIVLSLIDLFLVDFWYVVFAAKNHQMLV